LVFRVEIYNWPTFGRVRLVRFLEYCKWGLVSHVPRTLSPTYSELFSGQLSSRPHGLIIIPRCPNVAIIPRCSLRCHKIKLQNSNLRKTLHSKIDWPRGLSEAGVFEYTLRGNQGCRRHSEGWRSARMRAIAVQGSCRSRSSPSSWRPVMRARRGR